MATVVEIDHHNAITMGVLAVVALGIFGALTKIKSAANDLPYTSQVALGLAQASRVAH